MISSDAGSNLLKENINPETKEVTDAGRKRFFDLRRDYTAPTDGQFRNYSEHSSRMFKKMMSNLAKAKKDNGLLSSS